MIPGQEGWTPYAQAYQGIDKERDKQFGNIADWQKWRNPYYDYLEQQTYQSQLPMIQDQFQTGMRQNALGLAGRGLRGGSYDMSQQAGLQGQRAGALAGAERQARSIADQQRDYDTQLAQQLRMQGFGLGQPTQQWAGYDMGALSDIANARLQSNRQWLASNEAGRAQTEGAWGGLMGMGMSQIGQAIQGMSQQGGQAAGTQAAQGGGGAQGGNWLSGMFSSFKGA